MRVPTGLTNLPVISVILVTSLKSFKCCQW